MKESISYLKLDLRISKKSILMVIPALIFMAYIFFKQQVYIMGISYLLLIKIIFINTPFMSQGDEGLGQLHYIFPAKISKMVLGRYMYLILWYLVTLLIEVMMIIYLYNMNKISNKEIIVMGICEIIVATIICIQYPISYKIGFKNSKIILNIMSSLPGIIMMSLPSILIDSNFLRSTLDNCLKVAVNNEVILIIATIMIITILGCISYSMSCGICKGKEV